VLLGLAPVAPGETVAYGPHPDQVVDFYRPVTGDAGPLVVLLHGGFWRAAYDRAHLSPLAAELARHGLTAALVEYRRVGSGGGWPQTFEDVTAGIGAAVGTVTGAAAEGAPGTAGGRGGRRPVVVVGHSAGGHLALLAAARPAPAGIDRVIAVSPVADLARAHELGLSDGAVAEFLGPGAGLADRMAEAEPVRRPGLVPVTLLHGTADEVVPVEISRRYAVAADRVGGHAGLRLCELPGVGHYAPVTPRTQAQRSLFEAVLGTWGYP
jgi:acetyl esterase/lipase